MTNVKHMSSMKKPMQQQGFTLIELMISIILGLLVIAAAMAIFLSGQRSLNMQTGMSELQQNSIFGLSQLTHDLRHVNLNTTTTYQISKTTPGSGVIFNATNYSGISTNYVTTENKTTTNMNERSDQLTIQYMPNINDMVNCEGTVLTNITTPVVQRYYIEAVTGGRYNLMCDAGGSNGAVLGQNAQVLLQDIEVFQVRFGVKSSTGNIQYKRPGSITDTDKIVSAEVGVIARSSSSIGRDSNINNPRKSFALFGRNVGLKAPTAADSAYLREVFSQVVVFRNSQGS